MVRTSFHDKQTILWAIAEEEQHFFQFLVLHLVGMVVFVGFSVIDRGCCGIGRNQGQITCLPFAIPCMARDQYVFWDAFHPSHAANKIIARRAYAGPPSDCYPINVKQMAQV